MKITHLDAVEVVDTAAVEVESVAVNPAPAEVLPEPLDSVGWVKDARQAVIEAQAHHAQVVANIASIAASLEALQSDLAEAEASLKVADHPDLTGDLDADLATIELQASHGAALSGRCAMLRRKIPMVQSVLKNAEAQEREARLSVRDAQEDAFKGWTDQVDLEALLRPLLKYRAALRLAGRWEAFDIRLREVLNSRRQEETADRELRALMAIPGKEPEPLDEPEPVETGPVHPPMMLVATDGQPIERALTALRQVHEMEVSRQPPDQPMLDGSHYLAATNAIYAARSLPRAA